MATAAPRPLEEERWLATWRELGFEPPAGLAAALAASWQEQHRAYHTIEHLERGLEMLAAHRLLAAKPAELDLAYYFHDAVYDPKRSDNEEKSAEMARRALLGAGGSAALAGRIAELVMATKHQAEPPDADAALLVDVDLAILGARLEDYDRYEKAVAIEYSFVPRFLFRRKRREILAAFLARPAIYLTPALRERFEAPARENLARAIADLS